MTPKEKYQKDMEQRHFRPDPEQQVVVEHLEDLYHRLINTPVKKQGVLSRMLNRPMTPVTGLYLWGGVGRGKSYLMDSFFDLLPIDEKQRIHFHKLMQTIHEELSHLPKSPDPLQIVARNIAAEVRVLCVDEFHVNDIGDAMLLAGLLRALFDNGVTLVTTSNLAPDELYKTGLQRTRFLPAIALIKEFTEVVNLDSPTDYRSLLLAKSGIYHLMDETTDSLLEDHFAKLAPRRIHKHPILGINSREVEAIAVSDDVVWFEFREICQTARSSADYLYIGRQYHTVFISHVPQLDEGMDDVAQRFINLIDALYDHSVKTIISAAVEPTKLYVGRRHEFAFERTVSRINEMASDVYLAKPHRL